MIHADITGTVSVLTMFPSDISIVVDACGGSPTSSSLRDLKSRCRGCRVCVWMGKSVNRVVQIVLPVCFLLPRPLPMSLCVSHCHCHCITVLTDPTVPTATQHTQRLPDTTPQITPHNTLQLIPSTHPSWYGSSSSPSPASASALSVSIPALLLWLGAGVPMRE